MPTKVNVLLVDDIQENLVALEALLRRPDVEILTAQSGPEALELILRHEFALALVDVQMPDMDGFELAELMRGAERSKYIPIIFVTAGSSDAHRMFRGYESGAVDFLFKPIDSHMLRHKADTFIKLHQQRELLAQQLTRIQESESKLAQAVQAREDVLAVVSHDMRNFLQAIKSGVALLSKGNGSMDEETQAKVRTRIQTTVDLMTRMIADLMDMTNIRAGRISVTPRPERLGNVLDEAISVHEPLAQAKSIELIGSVDAADMMVSCDRERVLQVLANVLGNSIKFSGPDTRITVTAQTEGDGALISIEDQGPGIAPAELPHVFDAYWSGSNNQQLGTGLGLYITRSIIEAHGQRIGIESEVGRGTKIYFSLARANT
jgi:two-component system sensor histidine kinase/response regulator